jgi:thiamine biosynthesis lipoprotein ApbE
MRMWGNHQAGKPWYVGTAQAKMPHALFALVPLLQPALVTSTSLNRRVLKIGQKAGR